jgi:hypothetical protein
MLNISNQFRILTAPDINTELNPANEILRFSDHLVWLENFRLWQHQYNRSREWNIKPPEPKPEPVSELESEDSEEKEEDKVNLKPQEISYAKVTTKFKVRDKRNHSEESEQDSTSVDSQSVAKEKHNAMPFQFDYEKLAELLAPKIFELQQQHQKVSAYSCEVTDTNIDWSKPAKSYSH